MEKVSHICGYCRKAVATFHWVDDITGLDHHQCKKCEEEQYWNEKLFWEQYGIEID